MYTKGPWTVGRMPNSVLNKSMKGNSHVTYSLINTRVETENEADANARLIAAAPELLEALTLALATIERLEVKHGSFSSVAGTLDVCRKAIDKAEGKA